MTSWGPVRTVAVAAALTCGLATGAGACARPSAPPPPDDASPEQVVRAYADAVGRNDCDAAAALVEDGEEGWCGDIDITALTVTRTTEEQRATESGGGPVIQRVWVELTTDGGDVSMPDGDHRWSYLLDRTGPNGAWRIYDQGMG